MQESAEMTLRGRAVDRFGERIMVPPWEVVVVGAAIQVEKVEVGQSSFIIDELAQEEPTDAYAI